MSGWADDFTYTYFERLLGVVTEHFQPHLFQAAPEVLKNAVTPQAFVRHDIDVSLRHAIRMAEIERHCGVPATYMIMTSSLLYRIQEASACGMIRDLVAMGHEVGLHFDCPADLRQSVGSIVLIENQIHEDCAKLEDILGSPVRSLSFHRPIQWLMRGPLVICGGRVNGYAAELMEWYLSDSKGNWREGEPLPTLRCNRASVLQLLVHPIWWGERHLDAADRLEQFFVEQTLEADEGAIRAFDRALAETLPGVCRKRAILD